MKVGLIGFGKTGKVVAKVILQSTQFSLEWVLRQKPVLKHKSVSEHFGMESTEPGLIFSTALISFKELVEKHPVDLIIDFSSKNGIYNYGEIASEKHIKIISAISHYTDKEQKILTQLSQKTVVFWSPNITVGVNFILQAAKSLQKIFPDVDIEIVEEHFKQKKGVSGTALKIAETLGLQKSHISSVRAGGIVGKHEIIFGFPYQTIRLTHESISRESFGSGVLFVAENLLDKKTGFYHFDDILTTYFKYN